MRVDSLPQQAWSRLLQHPSVMPTISAIWLLSAIDAAQTVLPLTSAITDSRHDAAHVAWSMATRQRRHDVDAMVR